MKTSALRFWLVLALLTLLLRAGALVVEVIDPDEAGHAVHTWVWMAGGQPYQDFIDNKQPLLYLTYRAIFALFGRSLIAVHLVTLPWLLATAWLLARCARTVWSSERAGQAAALAFTLASSAYLEKDMLATNTEVLMNLPLVAALLVALPRRRGSRPWAAACGGALLGLAALYNLKALIALPILVAAPLPRKPLASLAVLGGLALPLGIVVLWFHAQGALSELLYWNLLLNQKYAAAGVPLWLVDMRRGIIYGFPRLVLFLLATMVLWWAAIRSALGLWRDKGGLDAPASWMLCWLLLCFLPVCTGGRLYGHYFIQLLPPLAICCAPTLAGALFDSTRSASRRLIAWTLLLLPVIGLSAVGAARLARGKLDGQQPEVSAVAEYVQQHTQPSDRIFVWGYWSQLYYYARRLPATRFVYPQTLAGYIPGHPASLDPTIDPHRYMVPEHWDLFCRDLGRHSPTLIIDVAPAAVHFWENYPAARYPRLQQVLTKHYRREATVMGVVIYRLSRPLGHPPC